MIEMKTLTINDITYDITDDGAVRFDSAQELTEEQKAQARENLGVGAGSGSGIEVTAKPGQIIRVKETDENGKPTAWEAVPWGYTEGGMVEIFPEWTLASTLNMYKTASNDTDLAEYYPIVGEKYVVIFDGVRYECEAKQYPSSNDQIPYYIGNGSMNSAFSEAANTGEPFLYLCIVSPSYSSVSIVSEESGKTISIHHNAEIPHPIPGELLPEGVPYVEEEWLLEETDAEERTDDTFGKVWCIDDAPSLKCGETYEVIYNGASYTCVTQAIPPGMIDDPGAVVMGNLSALGGENTGEPFLMGYTPSLERLIALDLTGAASVKIGIIRKVVQKLDPRCLPDGAVRADVAQTLTEEQKAQARENIGVVSDAEALAFSNVKAVNHRGYCTEAPENTIPAYILSKQKGFNYVEADVCFSKDGKAVLLHDSTIDRTSDGTGNIADLTYAELMQYDFGSWKSADYAGTKIATFEEFIKLCRNLGLHPYIEIKGGTESQIKSLVATVKKYGMKGKVTWISFGELYLGYIKAADNSARLGYVVFNVESNTITVAQGLQTDENEVFIDANYSALTEENVALCAAADIPLEVWTVNSGNEIIALNPYVSGVTSDNLIASKVLHDSALVYTPPEVPEQSSPLVYARWRAGYLGGITGGYQSCEDYKNGEVTTMNDNAQPSAGMIPVKPGETYILTYRLPSDKDPWWAMGEVYNDGAMSGRTVLSLGNQTNDGNNKILRYEYIPADNVVGIHLSCRTYEFTSDITYDEANKLVLTAATSHLTMEGFVTQSTIAEQWQENGSVDITPVIITGGLTQDYPYYGYSPTRKSYIFMDLSVSEGDVISVSFVNNAKDIKWAVRTLTQEHYNGVMSGESTNPMDSGWLNSDFTIPAGGVAIWLTFADRNDGNTSISYSDIGTVIVSKK